MSELDQLREENTRLKAELAECKRDAERYKFLRTVQELDKWPPSEFPTPPWCIRMEIDYGLPTNKPIEGLALDQAIDAAMPKAGKDEND